MIRPLFSEALRPLVGRTSANVMEHEVLRIAAVVLGDDPVKSNDIARREVLVWAEKRSGGRLPSEAWNFENFEYMSGGRNSLGVRLRTGETDIWAIRADDPDKEVPGRVWTHEIVVGSISGQRPRFSVRQLVSTAEAELSIEPHSPGFLQQISETCGLAQGNHQLDVNPWLIESDGDASILAASLIDPRRTEPLIVLTVPDGSTDPQRSLIEGSGLCRATLGIGRVVVLPAEFTWIITAKLGKIRSVFGGAARVYLPGFSETSNPYDHRLFLAENLLTAEGQNRCARWMRSIAASESIRNTPLGKDVLAFGGIRNAALRAQQVRLSAEGAAESEQLAIAEKRISALEAELNDERKTLTYFDGEATKEKERAEAAEGQLRASAFRIQQLVDLFKSVGNEPEPEIANAQNWDEFATWCDIKFAGRLVLAAAARRNLKGAAFEDIDLAARSLTWLATSYRDGRLGGAEGDFRDVYLEPGVKNSPCGGDEFDFDWQGRSQTADWHIKNGGNTRDPRRCLRIYFCWDPETRQVVIAEMPSHRSSALS